MHKLVSKGKFLGTTAVCSCFLCWAGNLGIFRATINQNKPISSSPGVSHVEFGVSQRLLPLTTQTGHEATPYSQGSPRNCSLHQSSPKQPAKRGEMALTGQPEALRAGLWESNRKGGKSRLKCSLSCWQSKAGSLQPSQQSHPGPELGKVGRGRASPAASQPWTARRQRHCSHNTNSAGILQPQLLQTPGFISPDLASPWLFWDEVVPELFSFPVAACGKHNPPKKNFKAKNVQLCPLPPSGRDLPFTSVRSEQVFWLFLQGKAWLWGSYLWK